MFILRNILLIGPLIFCVSPKSQATEPDIVVALDGSGDFTKIQGAIDAVESNPDRTTMIFIKTN